MVARSSAPVIGAISSGSSKKDGGVLSPGKWELTVHYRRTAAHNHFSGTESAPPDVQAKSSYNTTTILTFLLSRQMTPRWSLNLSVPVLIGVRTVPGIAFAPNAPNQVTHGRGLGDIIVGAQTWLWHPPTEHGGNIAASFGLKLPTGKCDVTNTVPTLSGPQVVTIDQSIQPGDCGWGLNVGTQMYKTWKRSIFYVSSSYLVTPQDTNGVRTGKSHPSEAVLTIHDSYFADGGMAYAVPKVRSLAASIGLRVEGVPVRDLIGGSDGFREPGYAISLVPGAQYTRGRHTFTFNVPVPIQRNRMRSVPEIRDGRVGGSAFANYVSLASYSIRF